MVNAGVNYIGDIIDRDLAEVVNEGLLKATCDFNALKDVDCVAVCVPTPLDGHYQPDISYVTCAIGEIANHLHRGMLVVLESTTYPGTTEKVVNPILKQTQLKHNFF